MGLSIASTQLIMSSTSIIPAGLALVITASISLAAPASDTYVNYDGVLDPAHSPADTTASMWAWSMVFAVVSLKAMISICVRRNKKPQRTSSTGTVADNQSFGFGDDAEIDTIDCEHDNTKAPPQPKVITYKRKRKQFERIIFHAYDLFLEIANETSDIIFTIFTLYNANRTLFYASVAFLGASALCRLGIAFRPLLQPKVTIVKKKYLQYCFGVVVNILDPIAGQQIINDTIDETGDEQMGAFEIKDQEWMGEQSITIPKIDLKEREDAQSMFRIGLVMIFLEDIPELIIDILFVLQAKDDNADDDQSLFVISVAFTVLHLIRVLFEVAFEMKYSQYIPEPLVIFKEEDATKLETAAERIDTKDSARFSINTLVAVQLSEKKETISKLWTYTLQYSKTLTTLDLRFNDLGDVLVAPIVKALTAGSLATTLKKLLCVNMLIVMNTTMYFAIGTLLVTFFL